MISGSTAIDARLERRRVDDPSAKLLAAAAACERARAPARRLDAQIALAVFPALEGLEPVGLAVWQHPDGTRVRALRYSFSTAAASTLVPPGYWIEARKGVVMILGENMNDAVSTHPVLAIALSIAALRARASLRCA